MTKEEIIEMANKAFDESSFTDAEVLRFANMVAQNERERIIAENAPEIERCNAYIDELERLTQTGQIGINPEIVGYVAQKREWVGLTDEEIYKIAFELNGEHWEKVFKAFETKIKERNYG